ncbi:Ig-like domain-containing protein [Actinomadura fulvescens]|uniref:Ig-like domain-containing protein n=1 Tax=Actinomadura fulvescens TaxID=46160 RepID=A0ABP6C5J9_9ACTN
MSKRSRFFGLLLAAGLAVSACQSGTDGSGGGGGGSAKAPPAKVTITPASDTKKARPDSGVTVTAAGGKLDTVSVKSGSKEVPGRFNAARTEWKSTWTLTPSASYEVSASAKNADGVAAQASSKFRTLKPDETVTASLDWILEGNQGKKYGVGTPIILNFDREVHNKDQVEKALEVKAEKPVEGAWRWIGDQQVVYRTRTYWPAHQKVTLVAHLAGVRASKGVYGTKDLTRTFKIGASRISTVNLKKHKMTVKVDGKKVRTVPVSGGNGSTLEYTTTSGVHLAMEKDNPTRMISPGRKKGDPGYYDLLINYAVRISNSGEYLHQTAGEYYCLGEANCSHGCVRQPAKDAVWFYRTVQPGDVVVVTGTRRDLAWDNGWGFWEMPWSKWKQGSELD